jgi:hypothetical protein
VLECCYRCWVTQRCVSRAPTCVPPSNTHKQPQPHSPHTHFMAFQPPHPSSSPPHPQPTSLTSWPSSPRTPPPPLSPPPPTNHITHFMAIQPPHPSLSPLPPHPTPPHFMAFHPVKGSGRYTPARMTWSPAARLRVISPRRWRRSVRGVAPSGTSLLLSCGGGGDRGREGGL